EARQLAVNLERRRWLARGAPTTRIDVNTAAATMVFYDGGEPAWTGRVVVGAPKRSTPNMGGSFSRMVVNPPWTVPNSIAEEEILPKGAGYLRANNMVLVNNQVVQKPGPGTALGLVKFDMQNEHAIYLHDTPAKALFGARERHLSHGCVRVEKAVEFARFLAERDGAGQTFDEALASGRTEAVSLGTDIPVRLLYHSAWVDLEGRVKLGGDPYGWDARLAKALGLGGGADGEPAPTQVVLGP
ncbi:MAG TPA: L,D-transpeptidase family protein, partial [Phenylobacterium sp.]